MTVFCRRDFLRCSAALASTGLLSSWASAPRAALAPEIADPDMWHRPRTIHVFNANIKRGAEFTYWKDGAFNMPDYLALCALMLDHREARAVQLDPRLFDAMFGTQHWALLATGKKPKTTVTSGYRTPRTNYLVGGVLGGAHPEGKALDGSQDDVKHGVFANMLWQFGYGGVGLYAHHVHFDVGRAPKVWLGGYGET